MELASDTDTDSSSSSRILYKFVAEHFFLVVIDFWKSCLWDMSDKNLLSFLFSLSSVLKSCVHASFELYLSRNSGFIHLTSRVDLEKVRFKILDIVMNHIFYLNNGEYLSTPRLDFIRQKGYEYDYVLFYCL